MTVRHRAPVSSNQVAVLVEPGMQRVDELEYANSLRTPDA
jgi:hypothetical protein